jgi:BlaI family transcriptional regulator, penicillinase repressor
VRGDLTRRERQLVEILYELGEGTAQQIRESMGNESADATIRTLLRILEEKKVVTHRLDGKRFVYRPLVSKNTAASSALRKVLDVFFGGSLEKALSLHLANPHTTIDEDEAKRLYALIENKTRRRNRNGRSSRNDNPMD